MEVHTYTPGTQGKKTQEDHKLKDTLGLETPNIKQVDTIL